MYQFDVPLQEELLTDEESDGLQGFYNKGLCTFFDGKFYLPHSVDAALLCKAICGYNQYVRRTTEIVKKYIDAILASSNPRAFEDDFRLLYSGLIARKDEFKTVIQYLTQEDEAERIIKNLNPGFVLNFFHTENHNDSNALMNYYKKNSHWLKPAFLELTPKPLTLIYIAFKKHLNYNVIEDIFQYPNVLSDYLDKNYKTLLNSNLLRVISYLGNEFKLVVIKYYKENIDWLKSSFLELSPTSFSFINRVYKKHLNYYIIQDIFKNPEDLDNYLRINHNNSLRKTFTDGSIIKAIKNLGNRHRHILAKYKVKLYKFNYYDILRIEKNGFNFDGIHWGALYNYVSIIQKNMNADNQQHSIDLVKDIIQKVLEKKDSLPLASSQDLSLLFKSIASVDKEIYQELLEEESIILDIKKRLDSFTFTTDNLYLFSRFYFQPWCKAKMNELIDQADTEQQKVIKKWHDKVWSGLQEGGKTMESGSMLEYIHNKFFSGQQNN
jgi:hypothetical protein